MVAIAHHVPRPFRPAAARRVTLLLVVALLAATVPQTPAQAADRGSIAGAEVAMVEAINASRRDAGRRALAIDTQLVGVARRWSARMADTRKLAHNPRAESEITLDWSRWGENVAWRRSGYPLDRVVAIMHQSFMTSRGHRDNILGDFTSVGVGLVHDASTDTTWVTVNFAKAPLAADRPLVRDAVAESASMFADAGAAGRTARYAVVGRADDFADNLAGAALAGESGPLLYTSGRRAVERTPTLHPRTRAELDRVLTAGSTVYVLGGLEAVSRAATDELSAAGYRVVRIGGAHRVDTARRVADAVANMSGRVDRVLLARADDWADAVAAGGYAADQRIPLLLTDSRTLSPEAAAFLAESRRRGSVQVIALGGPVALSNRVVAAAGADRVAGPDRYATSIEIAERLWGRRGERTAIAVHGRSASGWGYALARTPRSAAEDAPLVTVTNRVPDTVAAWLSRTGAKVRWAPGAR